MATVRIAESLLKEIHQKFRKQATEVIDYLESLEQNPRKGKILGTVGGIIIKELKYKSFRFYFITDGFKLKCLDEKELVDLLLHFVRMSDKKKQQKVIDEIKHILRTIGPLGL